MPVEVAFAAGKSTPAVSCKCRCKKKKPDTLANPKKPVSTSFAEDVLKSMVATVKHNEFEAVNSYCSKLMDDHFAVMKKDVSDLCLSMTSVQSRMDQLVEDVDVIRKGITDGTVSMHNLTPQINQDGGNHDRNLDSYLNIQGHKNSPPQTDELIAALVADMNLQNQEMTVWRELFQKISSQFADDKDDDKKVSRHSPVASTFQSRLDQHDDDIHVKVERLEANLRDLERKQKKDSKKIEINQNNVTQLEAHLASIRKTLKTSKDSEIEYDSSGGARGSHSKHLFSRDPSENKKIFSPTSSYESKVDGLIADATNTKQKTKIYRTNTTKACRSLFQGLVDVQHATLELIGWTDQVQTAFGILSEKFFLMTNVCPGFKSTFRIDDRAYCTIPILDYDT